MNGASSTSKLWHECLKMSVLFVLLSNFKLCLKEGRKLKSACCYVIVSLREKFRTEGKDQSFSLVILLNSVFCCYAYDFLCCLNIPS